MWATLMRRHRHIQMIQQILGRHDNLSFIYAGDRCILTADNLPPRTPVQITTHADDITITSTHISMSATKKYIQPYIHKAFAWTKQSLIKSRQNNLHSVHSRPCKI